MSPAMLTSWTSLFEISNSGYTSTRSEFRFESYLSRLETLNQRAGEVTHAQTVLEAVVTGTRENEIGRAQLLQISQALTAK